MLILAGGLEPWAHQEVGKMLLGGSCSGLDVASLVKCLPSMHDSLLGNTCDSSTRDGGRRARSPGSSLLHSEFKPSLGYMRASQRQMADLEPCSHGSASREGASYCHLPPPG